MTAFIAVACSSGAESDQPAAPTAPSATQQTDTSASASSTTDDAPEPDVEEEVVNTVDQVALQESDTDEPVEAAEPAEPAQGSEPAPEETDSAAPAASADDSAAIAVPGIGESAWAIVVAGASDPFDPILEETEQAVAAVGFDTTITNCDVGAATALRMAPGTSFTVSAYAADEQDARGVAEQLAAAGLPGEVVEIVVDCG